ncbi:MAG TPA: hydroxymethylbilane synthase [Syntrophomonadaceae bacterium]|nr:hydroxymethylbilane synthase [Syntrophomonadaceae bacterium]
MKKLRLGTRGSSLALWQAETVAAELRQVIPGLDIDIEIIKTQGDKILDVALSQIGDKGLFTKEIEKELLTGHIDLAVHSMKDLPVELESGLCIGAVLKREDPRDVLLSHQGYKLADLPERAVLGTSSLRRVAQLKAYRSDLQMVDLRGNVETRIKKMKDQNLDGIILAWAGVKRLGFEELVTDLLPESIVLPAVGQGAIAIEIRKDDQATAEQVALINHKPTFAEVEAERVFLQMLQGGCQVPIGSRAEVQGDRVQIRGLVCSLDGQRRLCRMVEGREAEALELARKLANDLLAGGALEILEEIRSE